MCNATFSRATPALVAAALLFFAGTARAQVEERTDTAGVGQDTTQQDTTEVQNPPGYRGMERDTTLFPPTGDDTTAGAVEDRVTGEYDDTTWQDTTAQDTADTQNPPGYRGMERDTTIFPPRDTAATGDTTGIDQQRTDTSTADTGTADTATTDTSTWKSGDTTATGQPKRAKHKKADSASHEQMTDSAYVAPDHDMPEH